jgi:hypothetical protein
VLQFDGEKYRTALDPEFRYIKVALMAAVAVPVR